jgi:hypothetical protein
MTEPQQPPAKPEGAPSYQRGAASVPSQQPAEAAGPAPYPPPLYPPPSYPPGQADLPPTTVPFGTPGPRRRRGLTMTLAAFGLVLLIAGGGIVGFLAVRSLRGALAADPPANSAGPTAAVTTPAAPSSPTPTAEKPFAGDLRELLIDRPAGSSRWNDFPSQDGTLTVAQMVDAFDDWDELGDELSKLNYERGAAVHWTRRNGEAALVLLFQFDTEQHAREFATWATDGAIEGYTLRDGGFGSIPESVLFVSEEPDQDGDTSAIMVSRNREIVSYVTVWHPETLDLPRATGLANDQHQRLPRP